MKLESLKSSEYEIRLTMKEYEVRALIEALELLSMPEVKNDIPVRDFYLALKAVVNR